MKILILDDEEVRHQAFARIYKGAQVIHHAYALEDFCRVLFSNRFDLIHLDHDLTEQEQASTYVDGWGKTQYHNGQHAAKKICELPDYLKPKRVIIHSINPDGAKSMRAILQDAKIDCVWEPFAEISKA